MQSPIGGPVFRPNGPCIHPARANGPGTEVTIIGQAQRADSSSPLHWGVSLARIKSMVSADQGTDGPLGLHFPRLERTRADGPGWVNSWPVGPESCDHQ